MRANWRMSLVVPLCLFALLGLAPGARAQGSRKQDIVFNRFGQPVAGATVTVCTAGATGTPCSPLAIIYSNVTLTTQQANPFTTDGLGNYYFYAAPGRYIIQFSGAGLSSTTTIPDVILPCDPSNCSASSISVTNGISAFSLTLSGNLAVSGTVTTGSLNPASISTTQAGAAPSQVGPHWYPGTATGLCTAPTLAPTVTTEGATGGTIGTTSLLYKIVYFNRNGTTTASPSVSFAPGAGNTNRVLIQATDLNWQTGCYGFRVGVSSDGGVTYWEQTAWTLPVASFASLTRTGNIVSAVTQAAHGYIPGQQIVVAGVTGGATSFNGTFTLIGQQMSTPTTLFWLQTGGNESANPTTGTGTVIAGLGADSLGHFAPGDFIISSIATSGTQLPTNNTATIDPLQVALNATFSADPGHAQTHSVFGALQVNGPVVLTTPLIVGGQERVRGAAKVAQADEFNGAQVSQIKSAWTDSNLGTVMVMGGPMLNTVNIEGVEIVGAGHGLVLVGAGPGFGNQEHLYRNLSIRSTDTTGVYSAFRVIEGTYYNIRMMDTYLSSSGLACMHLSAVSGGYWFIDGGSIRWDCAGQNSLLSTSSVTDPDRGVIRGAFPNGVGAFYVRDLFTESAHGIQFDAMNLGLHLKHVLTADPNAAASTPAIVRVGSDANSSGGNFNDGIVLEDLYLQPAAGYISVIRVESNQGNQIQQMTVRNVAAAQTNFLDCNNSQFSTLVEGNGSFYPYESAPTGKLLNCGTNAPVTASGILYDQTVNTRYAMHRLPGGILFSPPSSLTNHQYLIWSEAGGNAMEWFGGDPATASNKFLRQTFSSGGNIIFLKNDGVTPLFQVNASSGANTVTTGAPFTINGGNQISKVLQAQPSLTFGAIAAQTCGNQTVTLTGAGTSNGAFASPNYAVEAGLSWSAFVSASNTVTVRACNVTSGSITPSASSNWRVWVVQE